MRLLSAVKCASSCKKDPALNPRSRAISFALAGLPLFGLLSACTSKPAVTAVSDSTSSSSEAAVHNAFTDYVDRGKTTLDKAQSAASAANAQIQTLNQQAQSAADQ